MKGRTGKKRETDLAEYSRKVVVKEDTKEKMGLKGKFSDPIGC